MSRGTLVTTVVRSYPQPDWLIDRRRLRDRLPPRARASELWRVAPELLEQAQDDATILAVRDMELAGIDVVTDGEIRRESYSNRVERTGVPAPDCGMKYLSRESAFAKLEALVEGARIVEGELG